MAGVVLENVSRVFPGGVAAVRGVSLEVLDREFLVLVGPSGCGKTTTLRLVAGLEELSSGTITIGGRRVNDVAPKDRDIAMVFQNYALYPHMNVYRNMAFGLELRQRVGGWWWLWQWALPRKRQAELAARRYEIAERVHRAAHTLSIDELLERFPRQLSGGQRQRVALGRAIVRNPAVFLFDEPLSNLDAKLRVEMRRELKQLHQRLQTTMIYVTHDQVEALTLGERIVVMNDGEIQQVGPPMEVYDWPANRFVAGFIGTPAMNFIDGRLEHAADGLRFSRAGWSLPLAERISPAQAPRGGVAVLGVRPEDVRLANASGVEPATVEGAVEGVVRLVEMLGDATLATVELAPVESTAESAVSAGSHKTGGNCVVTKLDPRSDLRPGQRVALEVDVRHVHLFDPATGENWVRRDERNERVAAH